jgi:hypothetical protein
VAVITLFSARTLALFLSVSRLPCPEHTPDSLGLKHASLATHSSPTNQLIGQHMYFSSNTLQIRRYGVFSGTAARDGHMESLGTIATACCDPPPNNVAVFATLSASFFTCKRGALRTIPTLTVLPVSRLGHCPCASLVLDVLAELKAPFLPTEGTLKESE